MTSYTHKSKISYIDTNIYIMVENESFVLIWKIMTMSVLDENKQTSFWWEKIKFPATVVPSVSHEKKKKILDTKRLIQCLYIEYLLWVLG